MWCTVPLNSFVLLAQAARNVEVQVVEDGKKGILCFGGAGKKLDIVNDQYINQLVKVDKIINIFPPGAVNKLVDKLFRTYI